MNCILGILLLAAASTLIIAGNEEEDTLILLSPAVSISRTPEESDCTSGVIYGVKPCENEPGNAAVLRWTYEGCSYDHIGPTGNCQILSDSTNRKNIFSFVPKEDIPGGLGIRFKISAKDVPLRVYELLIPNSAVEAGTPYTVLTAGSPKKEFQGKTMRFQQMIYKQDDDSIIACREADFDNI